MKNISIFNEKLLIAFAFAKNIAKQTGGRIATLPDLAVMRTKQGVESFVWNRWMTPMTTLYFGTYKAKRLIVVAHHFGPLTSKKRLLEWVKSGDKKSGDDREQGGIAGCPKITQKEFNALVEGKYGEIQTVDFDEYFATRLLPEKTEGSYGKFIHVEKAKNDPLLRALLGRDDESFEGFVNKCFQVSKVNAEEKHKESGAENWIFELSIEDRYGWELFNKYHQDFPKKPIAFMLNLHTLSFFGNHDLSVGTEIHTEEHLNYSRFIVLRDENSGTVELEFNPEKHWNECLVPVEERFEARFVSLTGDRILFVEYPKQKNGSYMDTGEPIFPISSIVKVGGKTTFRTNDCLFFLKYHINEVRKVAPKGANAYHIYGDITPGETVDVPVQFYKIKFNRTKRILRDKEVMKNLPLLLKINKVSL